MSTNSNNKENDNTENPPCKFWHQLQRSEELEEDTMNAILEHVVDRYSCLNEQKAISLLPANTKVESLKEHVGETKIHIMPVKMEQTCWVILLLDFFTVPDNERIYWLHPQGKEIPQNVIHMISAVFPDVEIHDLREQIVASKSHQTGIAAVEMVVAYLNWSNTIVEGFSLTATKQIHALTILNQPHSEISESFQLLEQRRLHYSNALKSDYLNPHSKLFLQRHQQS